MQINRRAILTSVRKRSYRDVRLYHRRIQRNDAAWRKNQLTPTQAMAAKVAADGSCDTASLFSYGFDPYLTEKNPMLGSVYAVIMSLAKLTATGGDIRRAWLTLQEYFERTSSSSSWGKPLAALLGAWWAQKNMGTPAIGGKDSMSGTFEDIHVPPTLVRLQYALRMQAS